MASNRFGAFCEDGENAAAVEVSVRTGMTTITYQCHPGVVGALVGRGWTRIKKLKSEFRALFPGYDFANVYNGNAFEIALPFIPECVAFMNSTFGVEIALANEPIKTVPEYVGAVVGKYGCGLRKIEFEAPCLCTIYHDGAFYVKFPCDIPTSDRAFCMGFVRQALYGRAKWLEDRLWDERSSSETRSVASFVSSPSESVSTYSGNEPTPSEAFVSPCDSEAFGSPCDSVVSDWESCEEAGEENMSKCFPSLC